MRYADGRWANGRWQRKSRTFTVAGRTTSTGGNTNDDCYGMLWNPSTSRSLWVTEIIWQAAATGATQGAKIRSATGRGTAGSTVTPDLDNDWEREITPATGAVLDLGDYSVEPSGLSTPEMMRGGWSTGQGMSWQFLLPIGIRVIPLSGLGLFSNFAGQFATPDLTFRFHE